MEELIKKIITGIGEDPKREGLKQTPERVVKMYKKIFSGYQEKPENIMTVFDSEKYDEMIVCKNIEFYSMCEHHMLPFLGTVSIAYIPNKKIIGLSKLPRIVEIFSRRMQNQERMTNQIAATIMKFLKPKGVGVVIKAQHLCMMMRGVEKKNAEMITSDLRGVFKKNLSTRNEFMNLIK